MKFFFYLLTILFLSNFSQANAQIQPNHYKKEVDCLSEAMYYEGYDLGDTGMKAIGHVIVNRSNSDKFPDSICKVVNQRNKGHCQFSYKCQRKCLPPKDLDKLNNLSIQVLKESDFTQNAMFFHTSAVHPGWTNCKFVMKIGNTLFYKKVSS